jgi:hypothetical protein
MPDNNNKGAGIASQLGREQELDPQIAQALKSQGVNVYDSQAATVIDEEFEERQTESEIRENNQLDPAKRPFNRLIWAGIPICLFIGVISFFMFGGSPKNQVANLDPTTTKQQPEKDQKDKVIEKLQQDLAAKSQQKDIAMVPGSLPSPSITPSPSLSPSPAPKVTPSAPVAKATSSPKPQIVYKTVPQPISKPSPASLATAPQPSPQSFIPLGGGQAPRRERRVRPQRQPLASEKDFLAKMKPQPRAATPTGDPLIAGSSAGAHLMATLQFNNSGQSQGGQAQGQSMQVVLEQPLKTSSGSGLPRGTVLLFQVSSNPQGGAITATSGDALVNGKLIRIQKGAITIQSPNGEPLIAKSYRPGMDGLAAADRNNAILGSASAVGDELTKGSATTVIGNGSTVVSQNNTPNIFGAVAKGAFGSWSTDQRQRTQAEATKLLAAPPVQILPRDTRLVVTATFPAPIIIPR